MLVEIRMLGKALSAKVKSGHSLLCLVQSPLFQLGTPRRPSRRGSRAEESTVPLKRKEAMIFLATRCPTSLFNGKTHWTPRSQRMSSKVKEIEVELGHQSQISELSRPARHFGVLLMYNVQFNFCTVCFCKVLFSNTQHLFAHFEISTLHALSLFYFLVEISQTSCEIKGEKRFDARKTRHRTWL